jgi:hypothetical protein
VFTAKKNIATIRFLDRIVGEIEQEVGSQIKIKKQFISLLTTPGIGNILGLTIMLEVGNIGMFKKSFLKKCFHGIIGIAPARYGVS